MKTTKLKDLGKKFLVEDCQKIRIEGVVKKAKKSILTTLVKGMMEVGGVRVTVTSKKLHHGGERLYFKCPLCGQVVGILYKHPFQKSIGCRKCLNLEYRSRRYKGMIEGKIKKS